MIADQVGLAIDNHRLYESVREQQSRMEAVLQSSADAIIATDNHGVINLVNHAAEMLFGLTVGWGNVKVVHAGVEDGLDGFVRIVGMNFPKGSAAKDGDRRKMASAAEFSLFHLFTSRVKFSTDKD